MAEDLQHLINRLRTEAVETAEKEAEEIRRQARDEASRIISDAEAQAQQKREEAEKEAQKYSERGQKALEQAARDQLIEVGRGIDHVFERLLQTQLAGTIDHAFLKDVIGRLIERYLETPSQEGGLEVLLEEEDRQRLQEHFQGRFQEVLEEGVELRSEEDVGRGFRVVFKGENAEHDLTAEALAESLSRFLRPDLAKTVRDVAQQIDLQPRTDESPQNASP